MRAADKKRKRSLANHRFLLISVVGLLFIASFLVSRSLRPALPDPTKHEGVGRGVAEVLLQGPLVQGPLGGTGSGATGRARNRRPTPGIDPPAPFLGSVVPALSP